MKEVAVNDAADPRLDEIRDLRAGDAHAVRDGIVVAESITVVTRLVTQRRPLRRVVATPAMASRLAEVAAQDDEVLVVERSVLDEVVGFALHRGVIATLDRPAPPDTEAVLAHARTLVVLEGLNDAENLGAIARSALALGADAIVMDPRTIDPFRRRVVRVSMGAVLEIPILRATRWPEDLELLDHHGFRTLGLTPRRTARPPRELDLHRTERLAVVVGAEGPGLEDTTLARIREQVRIPMRAGVDSLNVAHAVTAILAVADRAPTIDP